MEPYSDPTPHHHPPLPLQVHAQISMRNAALFEENQSAIAAASKATKIAQTLLAMARTLSSELDLKQVVKQIMFQAKLLLDCERCSLFIVDRPNHELVCYNFNETQEKRLSMESGLAAHCAKTGELVYEQDAYKSENFSQEQDRASGRKTRGVICLPVTARESSEVLAVIQAMNKNVPAGGAPSRGFVLEDLELLKDFATHAEIALMNARLWDEKSKLLKVTAQSERDKSALLKMTQALSSNLDLRSVVREVMLQAKQLMNCDICTMFMVDRENDELITYNFRAQGGTAGDHEERRVGMQQGIAAHVAKTGEPLNLADAYEHPDIFNDTMDQQTGYRTRSVLCVPVFSEGISKRKVVAVIQTINRLDADGQRIDDGFTDEDYSLLSDFTSHAQIALKNARKYERITSKYQLLSRNPSHAQIDGKHTPRARVSITEGEHPSRPMTPRRTASFASLESDSDDSDDDGLGLEPMKASASTGDPSDAATPTRTPEVPRRRQ